MKQCKHCSGTGDMTLTAIGLDVKIPMFYRIKSKKCCKCNGTGKNKTLFSSLFGKKVIITDEDGSRKEYMTDGVIE